MKRMFLLLMIFPLVVLLPGCKANPTPQIPSDLWQGWTYNDTYTLAVTPTPALLDEPVSIRAGGMKPQQPVILRARWVTRSAEYESYAAFAADSSGVVDTSQNAPLAGDYSGVDALGLFWSMKKVKALDPGDTPAPVGLPPQLITFTLEAQGQVLATQQVERQFYDEAQVERREVSQEGLVATFYTPKAPGPHPGIIWLGGSEGGLSEAYPALLASHGYATLALAYFKAGSLPPELVQIPLEYGKQGIDWFRAQPEVDPNRVALLGGSKGAELALLLAATYPADVQAVVAVKPSSVAWMGMPANPADTFRGPKSSWTLNGQPLPFASGVFSAEMIKLMIGRPAAMTPVYAGGLKDVKAVQAARIPVEKIQGPVLLISGADDQLWPSTQMGADIIKTLDNAGFAYPYDHWAYKDVGHGLGLPNTYTTYINQGQLLLGGTPKATADANLDYWARMLDWLDKQLADR